MGRHCPGQQEEALFLERGDTLSVGNGLQSVKVGLMSQEAKEVGKGWGQSCKYEVREGLSQQVTLEQRPE